MGHTIAIMGATGAVGSELLKLLEERRFPVDKLRALASSRSAGRTLSFAGKKITVEEIGEGSFDGVDLVLSSASGTVSTRYAPLAVAAGAVVVDNTSAFRMDPEVPLVVPEINADQIRRHKGIVANPNCVAIISNMALYPLYAEFGVRRVTITSYQAASGAGLKAMEELKEETRAVLDDRPFQRTVIPHPYAFNFFVHNTPINEQGYVAEEWKVINETRKILGDPTLSVNATCIRVPVLRAHGVALNIEFARDVSPEDAYAVLGSAPGIEVLEDRKAGRFPMPSDASGRDPVYVGRIRRDISRANTLDVWAVGDQIRKGAALNAVQIAEALTRTGVPV